MNRKLASYVMCLSFVMGGAVQASDAVDRALKSIPGDAMGFLTIPSLQQMDGDYKQAVQDLGLQMFLAPPMDSLVSMVKQNLPMLQGLDESAPISIVLMPADTLMELQERQTIILEAKDPKSIIEAFGGQPTEAGNWSINLMGQPGFAAIVKTKLIVGPSEGILDAVKNCKTNMASTLKPGELAALEGTDIALWINGDKLLTLVRPMIEGMVIPMMKMQASQSAFQATSAEANEKQIRMLMDGAMSISVGVLLDKAGLGLRFGLMSKSGSELAKQFQLKSTSKPLMAGLPTGKYLIASGQIVDPAQTEASLKNLDPWFDLANGMEGADKEKVGALKSLCREWFPMATAGRMAIVPLAPGPGGLFGVSVVIETADSAKWLKHASKAFSLAKGLASNLTADAGEEVAMALNALQFNDKAEEIKGASVQHLTFDLTKIDGVPEEDIEDVFKIIGKDGALFRLAPADKNTVVIGFGGGKDQMATFLDNARKNETTLDKDAGIMKSSAAMPKERASVVFIALDQILASVNDVMTALDEERLPVHMPPINAPLALMASGNDGMMQFDVFFPTDLLIASKNAGMAMMGSMMAPPPSGAVGTPD